MTSVIAPPTEAECTSAIERGDESAIDAAFARLASGVPPATLLALVKAMLGLGLGRVAETLLVSVGRPLLADPGLAQLAARLGRAKGGEVPRAEQEAWAEANIAALRTASERKGRALAADLGCPGLEAALASDQIIVLRDGKRRTQAMLREADGSLRFLLPFGLGPPAVLTERFAACELPVAGLLGLAPPHVIDGLLHAKREGRHPGKLIAFELDPLVVAAWLRSGDHRSEIGRGRLLCRFGRGGSAEYLEGLRSGVETPLQQVFVLRPDAVIALGAQDLLRRSEACWSDIRQRLEREAIRRAVDRGPAVWLQRFEAARRGTGTLRIAGIASRHTAVVRHMMRDWLAAFAARGHETTWITESDEDSAFVDCVTPFAEADFDLVLSINYLRSHPAPLIPVELPFVAWMQDVIPAAQTVEAGRSQGPFDVLVAGSGGFYESCFGYPRGQSIDAPNLTSWATYGAIGDEPRRPSGAHVVYIGHGWEPADALAENWARTPQARVVLGGAIGAFRAALERGESIAGFDRMRMEAAVLAPVGGASADQALALHWGMQTLFDRLFRHQALEWAASWCETRGRRMVIHGDGWERHPSLGRFAAGPIENGRALGECCRDAMVVLHANGNASLHQRLLDGVAAGGCVLTRWNPADEMPRHHRSLRQAASEHGIRTMAGLLDAAAAVPVIGEAIAGLERTLGCALARNGDPRRESDCRVIRSTGFWPAETLDEDGLFRHLVAGRGLMTPHGAADIAGFERSTFRTEAELHGLLDRIDGSDGLRQAIAAPMRASVAEQFTMEWLAGAIIEGMHQVLRGQTR